LVVLRLTQVLLRRNQVFLRFVELVFDLSGDVGLPGVEVLLALGFAATAAAERLLALELALLAELRVDGHRQHHGLLATHRLAFVHQVLRRSRRARP